MDRWRWVRRAWGAIGRTQGAWPAAPVPLGGHRADERLDPLPYHLRQRSSTTCGSASLLVAHALADPAFAARLLLGLPDAARFDLPTEPTGKTGPAASSAAGAHRATDPDAGAATDRAGAAAPRVAAYHGDADGLEGVAARFAAAERTVKRRTNALVGPTGLQPPWPHGLGTPPWGAAHEMTRITGVPYRARFVGPDSRGARAAGYDAVARTVAGGRTAPMFVGDGAAPRHVVLAVGSDGEALSVYDPASGDVVRLTRDRYVGGGFVIAGWTVPWAVVVPR